MATGGIRRNPEEFRSSRHGCVRSPFNVIGCFSAASFFFHLKRKLLIHLLASFLCRLTGKILSDSLGILSGCAVGSRLVTSRNILNCGIKSSTGRPYIKRLDEEKSRQTFINLVAGCNESFARVIKPSEFINKSYCAWLSQFIFELTQLQRRLERGRKTLSINVVRRFSIVSTSIHVASMKTARR